MTCAEKRGRPRLGEQLLNKNVMFSLSQNEVDMLNDMSINTGKSKSRIVRDAIKMCYKLYQHQR